MQPQPQPTSPDLRDLTLELQDWQFALHRAIATYEHLHAALLTSQGHEVEGGRKKGPPIFTMKASLDGKTPIDVALDTNRLPIAQLPHVLLPFIDMQYTLAREAIEEIATRAELLREHFRKG